VAHPYRVGDPGDAGGGFVGGLAVAGPDPGHSFPAIALCQRFAEAGDEPTLFTGAEWIEAARVAGIEAVPLDGLAALDDDIDAGA